ncbi:hypothetical protein MUY14_14835 [Amycolatopsis sp. FBCC-B4732]|uniref:hypothetical protein n=1 Tax=Amycolatopsis sp. FBCC-B4732 TaxID=3079339 RepID=UPI001FF4BDEF|nr:hypothetical protein [Amycolatopsis sp. FBCC-B4732]UOX91836.1 hypothetical protein MUY14_14835 [Amycolatopsis sp. FBCC-B4732]
MTTDLNILLTALHVKIDDHLTGRRLRGPLAGWAKCGFCRSHSRWFWGLRLHLVCTPAGLPIVWAPAGPTVDERQVLMAICDHYLAECGVRLIRPSYRNRKPASPDASWPLPPPSGTTAPPAGPSPDP